MSGERIPTTSSRWAYLHGLTPEEVRARGVAHVDVYPLMVVGDTSVPPSSESIVFMAWDLYQRFVREALEDGYSYT
jgi:hypothetical protein